MPTGYTAPLHDGQDLTLEQFVMRCSRAMGAAIMQRDESLDVEIELREVSPWHIDHVEKSKAALVAAFERTNEDWAAQQADEIAKAIAYRDEYLAKQREIGERYDAMLGQVEAWVPPTPEHFGLKKFMVDQLRESIQFDVGDYVPSVPAEVPVHQYRDNELARLARALDRDNTSLEEERERVRGQNAWVTALRDSFQASAWA